MGVGQKNGALTRAKNRATVLARNMCPRCGITPPDGFVCGISKCPQRMVRVKKTLPEWREWIGKK